MSKKISNATRERLRELRRKHGLGEFRSSKKRTVRRRIKKEVGSMARRRARTRYVARAQRYYRRTRGKFSGVLNNPMLNQAVSGIGTAVLVQKYGGQFLGGNTNLVALGAAYMKGGIVGAGAAHLTGVATIPNLGNLTGGSTAPSGSTLQPNW